MASALCKGAARRTIAPDASAPQTATGKPSAFTFGVRHRGALPHCVARRSIQDANSAGNSAVSAALSPQAAFLGGRRLCSHVMRAATEGGLSAPQGQPGDEASKAFAVAMAKVADETKCTDVVVLDVAPVVSWTSFMLICTVMSKPQLLATLARVEKAAAESFGRARLNLPGSSPWETLDFGDVVVHVFTAEQRDYYDIESFYAAAEEVDLPFLTELPAGQSGSGAPSSIGGGGSRPTWSTTRSNV